MDHPHQPSTSEQALSAARAIAHQQLVEQAAAEARTPAEWVDIFQSVIEFSVKTTLEASRMGDQVLEKLADFRSAIKVVRHRFQSHGLPLSEDLDFEGPEMHLDNRGMDQGITWPHGRWVRFLWPDHSVMEFRGYQAFVAMMFIRWWDQFAKLHQQQAEALAGGDGMSSKEKRIIEPGSSDWNRYFGAKAEDMARFRGETPEDPPSASPRIVVP